MRPAEPWFPPGGKGRTSWLWTVCFRRQPNAISALLERGALPGGAPPLHAAAFQADGEAGIVSDAPLELPGRCIDLLAEAGDDLEDLDENGQAALFHAIDGDGTCLSALRALLEHGAVPNVTRDDESALICAVHRRSPRAVALLLRYGADRSMRDRYRGTALDAARDWLAALEDPRRVRDNAPIDDPDRDDEYQREVREWAEGKRGEASGLEELLGEPDGMKLRCIIALLADS